MCNRVRDGRSYPRTDGWDRPRYLRENIAAVMAARDAGVPVAGYWHWSLVDNYEWGSYEPRFGLFGVDRARGEHGMRWLETDALGDDAAGAYRDIIAGLRSGDRSVLGPAHRPVSRRSAGGRVEARAAPIDASTCSAWSTICMTRLAAGIRVWMAPTPWPVG